MGNPLLKAYNIDRDSATDGGRYLRWKVLRGMHRDRPAEDVSLFVFDKKNLDRYQRSSVRDALLDSLRQDALKLQRLRHPRLLHLLEPLTEERASLAFVTRPVQAPLCNFLESKSVGHYGARKTGGGGGGVLVVGLPGTSTITSSTNTTHLAGTTTTATCTSLNTTTTIPPLSHSNLSTTTTTTTGTTSSYSSNPSYCSNTYNQNTCNSTTTSCPDMCLLEKKCGLLDIAEALVFLHEDAKLIHRNVNIYSIFVTGQGKWLLGGMGYSIPHDGSAVECYFTFASSGPSIHDVGGVSLDPPLAYSAPEMSAGLRAGSTGRCSAASDVYSFALVVFELVVGRPLLHVAHYDTNGHYLQCKASLPLPTQSIPSTLYPMLAACLCLEPSERPTMQAVLQSSFFQDINVRALRFLESLREKDDPQKVQFLQGLPRLLDDNEDFDDCRLLRERVLPPLLLMLPFSSLFTYVLPNLFIVLRKVSNPSHFQEVVWPSFCPVLTAKEIQIESVYTLLRELDFLLGLCTDSMVAQHFLPLILKCLELPHAGIQEQVLCRLCGVVNRFEYGVLRNSVLPRLLALALNAQSSRVRVCALTTVRDLSTAFDRPTLLEQIVPTLEKAINVDRSAPVCMAVALSLEAFTKQLGVKMTANRILPVLVRLLVEDDLNAEQFDSVLQSVHTIVGKIREARYKDFRVETENTTAVTAALGGGMGSETTAKPESSLEALLFEGTPVSATNTASPLMITPSTINVGHRLPDAVQTPESLGRPLSTASGRTVAPPPPPPQATPYSKSKLSPGLPITVLPKLLSEIAPSIPSSPLSPVQPTCATATGRSVASNSKIETKSSTSLFDFESRPSAQSAWGDERNLQDLWGSASPAARKTEKTVVGLGGKMKAIKLGGQVFLEDPFAGLGNSSSSSPSPPAPPLLFTPKLPFPPGSANTYSASSSALLSFPSPPSPLVSALFPSSSLPGTSVGVRQAVQLGARDVSIADVFSSISHPAPPTTTAPRIQSADSCKEFDNLKRC